MLLLLAKHDYENNKSQVSIGAEINLVSRQTGGYEVIILHQHEHVR